MFISKKTSSAISWTQFICSLIVILDHSFDYINYGTKEKGLVEYFIYSFTNSFITGLTFVAMGLFFFFSSLLLYKDWNEKSSIRDWHLKKLKSRFKSIFIPYILWNLIWTIAFLTVGFLDDFGITNITNHPTIFDFIDGLLFAKYNEVFWFMKVLIIYIIISPLIGILISRFKALSLIFCFFLSAIPGLFIDKLSLFNNFHNIFFWILGSYVAIHISSYKEFCYLHIPSIFIDCKKICNIIFIFLVMPAISFAHYSLFDNDITIAKSVLSNSYVLILSILGAISLFNLVSIYFSEKEVQWFVKTSFLIYTMHKPIEQFYNKIIAKLFDPNLLTYFLNLFGGLIFTLAIIFVIIKYLNKIRPKLLLILNGGRKIFD